MSSREQNLPTKDNVTEGKPLSHKALFTTGDMARMTGTTVRTVRHYEELGLLETTERTQGSRRLFTLGSLQKLKFITDLRELNIPLAEIGAILDVGNNATNPSAAAERLFSIIEQKLDELNSRINELKRIRDNLACMKETFRECKNCHISWDSCHCQQCDTADTDTTSPLLHVLWPTAISTPQDSAQGNKAASRESFPQSPIDTKNTANSSGAIE